MHKFTEIFRIFACLWYLYFIYSNLTLHKSHRKFTSMKSPNLCASHFAKGSYQYLSIPHPTFPLAIVPNFITCVK